ncbi:MAG: serine/threonine-protein kinase [Planctomycetota bacterium]|jgi:serine/threonine-protein kinase
MVSRNTGCDANRLRLLLHSQLPEPAQEELAAHVEICTACRRKLESLAAGAGWWSDARQYLRPEPGQEPTAARPSQAEAEAAKNRPDEADSGFPYLLDFLAPSEDPEKLGRLGPYEIVEVIGSGGMGVVLKGFDAKLNRFVAVKVLSPQLAASAAARRRFDREARAAAAVVHEHVVAIHAVASARELPYLVMPFVPGRSLAERIDQTGPLELKEILRIGMQAASGLAAAHAQGLVHRDVKPANLLLENGVERVMITDFGLARAVDDASLTQSGVLTGTPEYMAPEQAKADPVDARADLFSLGSVMYAMATGHSPFRAETTMAVLRRICEGKARPIRDVNPEIPAWLAEIIEKLHQKDPNARFPSASEVAHLLGRHLAHLQHPASVPMPERLHAPAEGKRTGRIPASLAAVIGVLLLVAGGLAATELLGLTHVVGFLTGAAGESTRQEPRQHSAGSTSEAPPLDPTAGVSESTTAALPSPLPMWDDGLGASLDRIGQETLDLETDVRGQGHDDLSPGAPYTLEAQLRGLEEDLNGTWP